jgi:hypothetical protein
MVAVRVQCPLPPTHKMGQGEGSGEEGKPSYELRNKALT